MSSNLLTEWLKRQPPPKDKQVRIANMIFHIPFNGENYLMFKCRHCGFCCNNQKQGALMLTFGDIKRLAKHFGYPGITKFLETECVWAEVTEPKEIHVLGLSPCNVKYAGYYLKRFQGENETSIEKPHRCCFLTADNLCQIQEVKPVVCRKFPYSIGKDEASTYHAIYVDVPWSQCQGYREKKKVKTSWLIGWVKPLIDGAKEVWETLENDLMQITSVEYGVTQQGRVQRS